MKTIYITTFQNADNYGAMLQCYALSGSLSEKYQTSVIDYDNKNISAQYKLIRRVEKNPLKTAYHFIVDLINLKDAKIRKNNFSNFRNAIPLTHTVDRIDDLKIEDGDIFIAGSDQIWNPLLTKGFDSVYFLETSAKDIKRISYAASCGSPSVLEGHHRQFKNLISKFDAISVRENSLANYIYEKTGVETSTVLDPTFLLPREKWEAIVGKKRIVKDKYIFVYSVGNANELFCNTVKKLARETGLKVIFFDKKQIKKNRTKGERWYKAGPSEFLNLLFYSEFVVTTSFHGFALSAILNKKMIVVLSTYPDRLLTLAETIGLSDRVVAEEKEAEHVLARNPDWDQVNNRLKKARSESMNWLISAIES